MRHPLIIAIEGSQRFSYEHQLQAKKPPHGGPFVYGNLSEQAVDGKR